MTTNDCVLSDAPVDRTDRPRWPWATSRSSRGRTIGLLEHCGTGNLGDEATVSAVLQQTKHRWPHATVIGLSLDPLDSRRRHRIECFAIRRTIFPAELEWAGKRYPAADGLSALKTKMKSIIKKNPFFSIIKTMHVLMVRWPAGFVHEIFFLGMSLRIAWKLDVLIICGGGQLLDWGGPWAFPYTLFKWILLAKLGRAKCVFLNNGAGPLDHPLSRWFVRHALLLADYVSLRDAKSLSVVRAIGVENGARVVADCAWALDVLGPGSNYRRITQGPRLTIGIAPMAYCDPTRHWTPDEKSYQCLIQKLAEFGAGLISNGHRLRLFSSDIWFDSTAIADLDRAIREKCVVTTEDQLSRDPVGTTDDIVRQLMQVDVYVTCRFHGVVFAHLLNVPALALAPHPKVTTLMEDFGLSEYCVDIAKCDADCLTGIFARLVQNLDDVKYRIRCKVVRYRNELAEQFDGLFPADFGDDAVSVQGSRVGAST